MSRRLLVLGFLLCCGFLLSHSVADAQGKGNKGEKGEKGGPKHVFSGPAPSHPFDIILARPTDNSVTISVMAYDDMSASIRYGTESGKLNNKTDIRKLSKEEPAEFVITGLQPDTQYYYQVQTSIPDVEHRFHTQRRPGSAFCFTIQSDSHLDQGTRPPVYELTLANALAAKPDFHVDIGDTFMTDKYGKQFKDARPQYIAQRYYFGRIAHSAPLFLVLGNHDGERLDLYDGSASCMPVWSCQLRKKLFPNPFPDGFYTGNRTEMKQIGRVENYYAWEWGDALMIALDPFWTTGKSRRNAPDGNWARSLGKEQYDWLADTLSKSKARFKFVFIHHLVGGLDENARGGSEAAVLYEWGGRSKDGKVEFSSRRPGWQMPIHQLLVKHKVSAVFHGHDHFYAHQELDDIAYVMVPQPGHNGMDRIRNTEEYGYVRGTFMPPSGHIKVSVTRDKATVDYIRTYLPQAVTLKRSNAEVAHSFSIYLR